MLNHIPNTGEIVYAPSFHERGYTKIHGGKNAEHDKKLFEMGLLFGSTEEAISKTDEIYAVLAEPKVSQEEESLAVLMNQAESHQDSLIEEDEEQTDIPQTSSDDQAEENVAEPQAPQMDESLTDGKETEPIEETKQDEPLSEEQPTEETAEEVVDDNERIAQAYKKSIELFMSATTFNAKKGIFIPKTFFTPEERVAGGILSDRIEKARESFIMYTSRKASRTESAEAFATMVENIPKEARAKLLAIMGPAQFAEMLTGFFRIAKEGM